ncbi:phage portal protein [Subtercola endophyticus]|uniref:phage portal protein n=1 Tax=Subtercola endophyticus TaxID=2895559 RepID=UPI001E54FFE8|nr:phage portal protein [Subtercola endophyticus]UFS59484.1 phage portal protein [Subtercola endophyticus]
MPLPQSDPKAVWPPANLTPILAKMGQWSAWYSGDLEKLQAAYGGGTTADSTGFFASDKGGIRATVGRTLQRFFVGQPTVGPERNTKLPVPIASEMCQVSADLLFADPVTIIIDDDDTQERVNELADDNLHATLAEAAEVCAALGGVYLRVTWDTSVMPDGPFLTSIDADTAIPEFKWGRLVAVTFWSVVSTVGKLTYRHLERHELDGTGVGVIRHGLYEGTNDTLGIRVSLTTLPETAPLAASIDLNDEGTISTLSPGLAVVYVPNQTPNRSWRTDPIGRNLGRSDLDGVEHLMDQLAEVMTAWVRAIRLAKARIFIAKSLLNTAGPGQGVIGNLEQEAYTALPGSLAGKDTPMSDSIEYVQAKVEYEQYQATAETLIEQILQMAGYSMQTFGVGDTGTVRTATEIESKERRSLMTRSRKIREWRPQLEVLLTKLLDVDNALFSAHNVTTDLAVEFTDGVQETQLALAQTVQALYTAESASVHERVTILHPDFDEDDVATEVARIKEEFGHPMPSPQMSPFDPDPAE